MANQYLINRYNACSENEKREGIRWYNDAHNFCLSTAQLYDIDLENVAAVVSVLSPRNRWERNKQDAVQLIDAKLEGLALDDFTVCTFTGNKKKAWELLDANDPFDPDKFFKGPKTRCFWDNIVYPNSQRVTIDTWAARAAYNTRGNWSRGITLTEYRKLEKSYQAAAKEVGMLPKHFQAVVWVSLRTEVFSKKNDTKKINRKSTVKR